MKLLYLTIQMNLMGGVARIVSEKANWFVAHGYEVTICDIEDYQMKSYYPLDSRVKFRIGSMSTTPGGMLTRLKGVLKMIGQLRRVIREERPDVIINAHCPLVTWVLPFLPVSGQRIMEIHQSRQGLEVFNRQFMSPLARWVHRWATRWIYGQYDKFVVLTSGDYEQWKLKNCVVIPNFVEQKKLQVPHELNHETGNDKRQILLLARLMPQKRIDLMIRIWASLANDFPGWHVKVLGEGQERAALEQQVRKAGLQESFLLPGEVKDVQPELSLSDILCLTSEYEGFGIVLIEAMQRGVPVMAFEYVGVHDIIQDGHDGIVVPFGDVVGYADKLRELMLSAEKRKQLATNAFVSVQKFDKEHVMQQWKELIG